MLWEMIWYEEDASGVVLNDNENEKNLGPHALLCSHALGDTPTSSWQYECVLYEAREWSLGLP